MQLSDNIINQYLYTALWSSTCDTGEFASGESFEHENYDIDDISESLREQSTIDLQDFIESADTLLDSLEPEQVAHDFWLTRCGHGTGFWDRGLGDIGEQLTALCKPFGNVDLYVGADGLVYGA